MQYEIQMPQQGSDQPRIEHVHGDNWLEALRRGLAAAGLPAPTRNLACDLQDDESVIVTDTGSGHVYRVMPVRVGAGRPPSGGPRAAPTVTWRLPTPTFESPPDTRASAPSRNEDTTQRPLNDPFSEDEVGVFSTADRTPRTAQGRHTLPGASRSTRDWSESSQESPTSPSLAAHGVPRTRRAEALERELAEFPHLGRDIHEACNFAVDVGRVHVPSGAGSVLLIDARDRCLYFAAARGPKAALVATQRIPLEVGIAGASIRQRQTLNIVDPGRDPRFAASFADAVGYHPRSIVCAPVFAGNKAFGVVELLDREQRDAFSDEDADLVTLLARRLGEHFASLLPRRG